MTMKKLVLPPLSMSPRHPAVVLLRDLIELAHQLSNCEKPQVSYYRRYTAALVRRVKLLGPFFEEIRESNPPLPPSAVLALKKLHAVLNRSRRLVERWRRGSSTWALVNSSGMMEEFQVLSEETRGALEALPLKLLEISDEMKEHMTLLKVQSSRSSCLCLLETREELLKAELCELTVGREHGDSARLERLLLELHLRDWSDCQLELERLRVELREKVAVGDAVSAGQLQSLLKLVRSAGRMIYGPETPEDLSEEHDSQVPGSCMEDIFFPDEFRCPISLEVMTNPVIIATGQTYDKEHIQKWIISGHSTCPKSGQKLLHLNLIPNHVLRSLIVQWCEENYVQLDVSDGKASRNPAAENVLRSREALEVARTTAAFLVGKLATGSEDVQKQVVYELRLLAKTGMENRICIAEAGAIPFLVPLLRSQDPKTQEDAVTALLNLSIYDNNKKLIMSANALGSILTVLEQGKSMEARQNAAATIFSLSAMDHYRSRIGDEPSTIPSLVKLLLDGTSQARKDATSALFNLLLHPGNRSKVVHAGATDVLVEMLKEEEVSEDALAVLALIGESSEGLRAINEAAAVPKLVKLLEGGSLRGKENSLSVLLALCKHGGGSVIAGCEQLFESLRELVRNGSPRARRKARSLLKLLYSQNVSVFS